MTITFYKSNNDPREIPKTYTGAVSKSCEVIEPFDLESPQIKVAYDTSLFGYSYAKITLGGNEYVYNVDPNITMNHGIMYINMFMSYIDTYTSEVLASQGHITRSGSSMEKWLVDELATQYEDDKIQCQKIGTGFTSGNSFVWVKGITYLDTNS